MRNIIRVLLFIVVVLAATTTARTALADDARFVGTSLTLPPASLCAGEQFPVTVTVKNTGATTWTRLGQYGLESPSPMTSNAWRVTHVDLPYDNIAPGQSAKFMFVIVAPMTPGDYAFQWQMHNGARGSFGNLAPPDPAPITITGPCPLSKVLLLKAGKGDALQNWCDPASPNVARGMLLPIPFLGRSTNGTNALAHLKIVGTEPPVQWPGGVVPHPTFGPFAALIDGISILVKDDAPLGMQYLKFSTLDENSVAGHVDASCNINIVQTVPDVAVTSLTVDAPYMPQAVVHFTLKNNGSTAVDVPWDLMAVVRVGNRNLASLVATAPAPVHLAAGASSSVNIPVASVLDTFNPASVTFNLDVDSFNTLHENAADRGNNRQSVTVSLPPPLETRELNPQFAQAAGAKFSNNIEPRSSCYRLGVGNWKDNTWAPDRWFPQGGRKTGMLFMADCGIGFGGRANPVAYENFQLKNGWHVKSVDAADVSGASSAANFNNLIVPVVGSDTPKVSMHVFATGGHWVRVGIRILIEGPAGTDPYGTGGVACGEIAPPVVGQVNRFCSSSADCDRGASCSVCGVCIPAQVAYSCSNTADCLSGFVCTNGQCQQPGAEAPVSCSPNQTNCTGNCRDLSTDNNNCGACGNVCGQFGNNNIGVAVCASGSCVNTLIDNRNCGTVGYVCPSKRKPFGGTRPGVCVAGHCR